MRNRIRQSDNNEWAAARSRPTDKEINYRGKALSLLRDSVRQKQLPTGQPPGNWRSELHTPPVKAPDRKVVLVLRQVATFMVKLPEPT